jgi:hypothetical protein
VRQLLDYLPDYLQSIREYYAIFEYGEQGEIENLWQNTQNIYDDQFIQTATQNGIGRWEKILDIVHKASDTLDDRRFAVLSRLQESLPYSVRRLKQMLATLCGDDGYNLAIDSNSYTLSVQVAQSARNKFNAVKNLLERIIPANLIVNITQKYNSYELLKKYTYGELHAYTFEELRTNDLGGA